MNFGRAKTILIIIFIFVNIFLLTVHNLFYQNETAVGKEKTIEILSNNGIKVKNDIKNFPDKLSGVEIENSAANEEKLVSLFLGKNYTVKKPHTYESEKESLNISDLSIEYKVSKPEDKGYKDISILNAGNKILKTLNKKGLDKSVMEATNISEASEESFFVTLSYSYKGVPVFNNNLYATASKEGLKTVKGTVISFKELKNTEYNILPVTNILLELPLNSDLKSEFKNPEITDIRLGYYLPMGKTEASIYAIPAFEIEINDKKIYYYDARVDINSDAILLGSRNIIK